MTRLVYLDTETDSLGPDRQIWEVAWIVRDPGRQDVEHHDFVEIDTDRSDPMALKIGRYYERHPTAFGRGETIYAGGRDTVWAEPPSPRSTFAIASDLARDLYGATLVGANPAFDAEALRLLLASAGMAPTWHYRLLDVEAMCAGARGWAASKGLDDSLAAYGLSIPEVDRHAAMGDTRAVRDLYDAILENRGA